MAGVFINYRVRDNPLGAATIHDRLARRFGADRVFRDVVSMAAGEDYPTRLRAQLDEADILVVVIGPQWSTLADPDGTPLIRRNQDWVRWEIARGFERGIPIVPVLLCDLPDDAGLPDREILPDDIRQLANLQVFEFSQKQVGTDLDRLIRLLIQLAPGLAAAPGTTEIAAETAESYDVFVSHAAADAVWVGEFAAGLADRGLRVAYDVLLPGDRRAHSIASAIFDSVHGLLVFSEAAMADGWVRMEYEVLLNRSARNGQRFVPVVVDGVELPLFAAAYQACDFHGVATDEYDRLMDRLATALRLPR